jgi:hypothetical protein
VANGGGRRGSFWVGAANRWRQKEQVDFSNRLFFSRGRDTPVSQSTTVHAARDPLHIVVLRLPFVAPRRRIQKAKNSNVQFLLDTRLSIFFLSQWCGARSQPGAHAPRVAAADGRRPPDPTHRARRRDPSGRSARRARRRRRRLSSAPRRRPLAHFRPLAPALTPPLFAPNLDQQSQGNAYLLAYNASLFLGW